MNCPCCQNPCTEMEISDHYDRPLTIDMCIACQLFWFDEFESLRMNHRWVRRIIKKIASFSGEKTNFSDQNIQCPRCSTPLIKKYDYSVSGEKILEFSCPEHGILLSFDDFFRLKNLYSAFQVADSEKPLFVSCTNCGNHIDPTSRENCSYCNTPFSFFDTDILLQVLGEEKSDKDPVGKHYLVNFYQCDLKNLAPTPEKLSTVMENVAQKITTETLTLLQKDSHFFGPNAVTGFFLLAESHVAFHTWPERNFVTADVFVCYHTKDNSEHAKNIISYLENTIFHSQEVDMKEVER